jgi:uncharacterized spore protein YtfJ
MLTCEVVYRATEDEAGSARRWSDMEVGTVLQDTKEALRVERVFGQPYEKNGLTIIPTAKIQGGGGGGSGEGDAPEGHGSGQGAGFGVNAKATGVFVVDGEQVRWQPAIDVNKILIGAQVVAVVALLVARSIAKARHKGEVIEKLAELSPRARRASKR